MRILSLLPSATEIVCALGREPDLVGRSAECDYPASVARLPVVMRARTVDSDRPSSEIDERVQAVRGSGESLYELDLERLRTLAPDVVLTQDLCGVCSVTEEEVVRACRSSGLSPAIVSLTPRRLEDVWKSVELIGESIGEAESARQLADALRARTQAARQRRGSPAKLGVVEWLDPPILAGLWVPDMLDAAGATSWGARAGEPGTRTTWESIRAARPDGLVLSPCSFGVARTRSELESAPIRRKVGPLAARLGVLLADEAYFSRPGPRLADGIELLRDLCAGTSVGGPMPVERWAQREEVASS
ncbi:MAG TPA: cobalamin-binding protein [Thermoplasmata archaeon]|nr:cobalamin-binding protein [Thermoplasmata archaeon]